MKIRTWLTAANICLVGVFVSIGYLGYEIVNAENELHTINTDSNSKVILIQELESTTNTLASHALKYLLTQDTTAKDAYEKMLDIRHGKAVRPYTTLVMPHETISQSLLFEKYQLTKENHPLLADILSHVQELEDTNTSALQNTPNQEYDFASEYARMQGSQQSNEESNQEKTIENLEDATPETNLQNNFLHADQVHIKNEDLYTVFKEFELSLIAKNTFYAYDSSYQNTLQYIHSKANQLITNIQESARLSSAPLHVIVDSYILYIQILLLLGIAILFLITLLCYTNIIVRINKASAFIAHMRLSRKVQPIALGKKDEISILNTMLNTLASKYTLLTDTQEAYNQVQTMSRQTQPAIKDLTEISTIIAQNLQTSSLNANEQVHNITTLTETVREINSSVAEVAKNASSAADIASQTRTKAEDGERFVQSLITSIANVQDDSRSLKEDMTTLLHHAKKVNEIMRVITDIADQTNLLALNAAIEAARAGDAGRGFAVVADEVRKLAEKTMLSTTDVGNAIESIHKSVQNSTNQVDITVENINNVTTVAGDCGVALQEIVSMAENSADQIRTIAIAAEEQSSSSDAIADTISHISSTAEEHKHIMEVTIDNMKELQASHDKVTNCVDFIALSNVKCHVAED